MLLIAAVFATMPTLARAADFSVILNDFDGQPLLDEYKCPPDPRTGARSCHDVLTLGHAAATALVRPLPGDDANARGQFDRWRLASRVVHASEVDLDAGDTAMIVERLAKVYGAAVTGPAITLLDPNFGKSK